MATRIVRDNCKDCTSSCEHAGKDREFVCVKGVSCKTVKPKPEMVAVVRCKDCRHISVERGLCFCNLWEKFNGMGYDGFCNYGETEK